MFLAIKCIIKLIATDNYNLISQFHTNCKVFILVSITLFMTHAR